MRTAPAAVALSLAVLAGCGDTSPSGAGTDPTAADVREALADGAVAIDVRTPSEFAAGHLADAVNIDGGSKHFAAKVGALDTGATYVVYCATGVRAARAVDVMTGLGFHDVLNGGGYDALAAAGVPTG